MAKRRAKPKPKPALEWRADLIGAGLVVIALLMLLSLVSARRGAVTGAIVDGLRVGFGNGVWAVPVVLGALGVWLAVRDVADVGKPAWTRIAGLAGLFLVVEALLHMMVGASDPRALAMVGGGGGMMGWLVSDGLISALGTPVTFALLSVGALIALMGIAHLTFAEVRDGALGGWDRISGGASSDGLKINPRLPSGSLEPWYTRWLRQLTGSLSQNGGLPPGPATRQPPTQAQRPPWNTGKPEPGRPAGSPPPVMRGGAAPATAARPAASGEPRIVGGAGQTWHTPALPEILEDATDQDIQQEDLRRRAQIIEQTLEGFGVPVQVVEVNQGPAITQFGLRPGVIVRKSPKGEEKRVKVRVSQIQALANDLSLALSASPIRIEAPVPGRDFVGIEVPNVQISLVSLRGVLESDEARATRGSLVFGLGRDVSGQAVVADLARMPHLLIAGATGSGKSVCVNAIITTLLLNHTPETLRILMVDPKRVELTVYNGIPHLLAPVVVDVDRAVPVLQWATREMERRYKLFSKVGARNIETYNEKLAAQGEPLLPFIVILIDELADLMLSAPDDVERYICRIAQMARATGMHLVLATQRPSVDVVTGLIKANFPARIAFAVTSQIDSRVILDTPGAEQLLGRGDMLFMAPDSSKLQRLQGCFVSDRESNRLVRFWRGARTLSTAPEGELEGVPPDPAADDGNGAGAAGAAGLEPPWLPGQEELQQPLWSDVAEAAAEGRDDVYRQAVEEVRRTGKASVSLLQRRLRIGYSRAARLIDQMEENGIIGPDQGGSRGREVLPEEPPAEVSSGQDRAAA